MSASTAEVPTKPQMLNGRPPPLSLGYPILFTGVLHCRYDAITNLLRKRFSDSLCLHGMDIFRDCWYLYVKSLHQVTEIMLRMDNLAFFGGRLCVRFVTEDGSLLDLQQLNRYAESGHCERPRKKFDKPNETTEFTTVEMNFFNDIFDVLHQLPHRFPQGVSYERALRAYRHLHNANMPEIVRIALRDYPRVLMSIAMQGKTVDESGCLRVDRVPKSTTGSRDKLTPKQTLESWEPFPASEVTDTDSLAQYMHAMLGEFGPMNVHFDLRLRLSTFFGSAYFQAPSTARELVNLLERVSPMFVVMRETIFDITHSEHRRLLRGRATAEFVRSSDYSGARLQIVSQYDKNANCADK